MKASHTVQIGSAILAWMLGLDPLMPSAWAQTAMPQGLPSGSGTGTAPTPIGHAWPLGVLLGVAVLVLLAAVAKAIDMKRQREEEAVHLQTQISDALLRNRMLAVLPVVVTVHIPIWRRAPATVEMHGQVPTDELRQAVMRVAAQEAARLVANYDLQDRMAIIPFAGARAA
jgi:hypothetical protein